MYDLNFGLDKTSVCYFSINQWMSIMRCSAGDNYTHDSGYSFSPHSPRVQGILALCLKFNYNTCSTTKPIRCSKASCIKVTLQM